MGGKQIKAALYTEISINNVYIISVTKYGKIKITAPAGEIIGDG
jgi:hypothetical protein